MYMYITGILAVVCCVGHQFFGDAYSSRTCFCWPAEDREATRITHQKFLPSSIHLTAVKRIIRRKVMWHVICLAKLPLVKGI